MDIIELDRPISFWAYVRAQYEAAKRAALYGFAAIGVFYCLQMTERLRFINVVVPTEVADELPKATVARTR